MRAPRLAAHYGFGAARLALCAAPHCAASTAAGLRTVALELASVRGLAAGLRGGALCAGALALAVALAPGREDALEREIVWLRPPVEVPVQVAALPPPVPVELPPPETVEPEPAPPPEPAEPVAAEPIEPEPAALEPRVPEPEPAPFVAQEPARPVIAPEPLRMAAPRPEPAHEPRVLPRPEPPRPARAFARLEPPTAPPAAASPPEELAPRPARATPASAPHAPARSRIPVSIDPLSARASSAPVASTAPPPRTLASAPSHATRATRARPPSLDPPRFAQASPGPAPAEPMGARASRSAAVPGTAPSGRGAAAPPRLRGVSLATLAACLSDREEDALRQRVVAAVAKPQQCTSEAGTWRFVETKNVNAFLLWIERSPLRRAGDRCEELTLALDCLARGVRRELHEG